MPITQLRMESKLACLGRVAEARMWVDQLVRANDAGQGEIAGDNRSLNMLTGGLRPGRYIESQPLALRSGRVSVLWLTF
jgi:hypothetical protein